MLVCRMASASETALQLFARLIPRPSLLGLDSVLFPDGPNPRDVVEISGEPSTGKTLLLTQFIVKCVLPAEWKHIHIGGLKAGVVLLNTDHHFHTYKLVSVMESYLSNVGRFKVDEVEEIVKEALGRLIIYNIADSVQLNVTMYSLQTVISNQPEISLILLDSVSAFYWQDSVGGGIRKMDLYTKTVIKTMQKILGDFKGTIIYTRPTYFQSKNNKPEGCSAEPSVGCVNKRIVLKCVSVNSFCAEINSASSQFMKMYSINSAGVQWVE